MRLSHIPMAAAIVVGAASAAPAWSQSGPEFRASGFGTVGWAKTDTDRVEFAMTGQPDGAGSSGSFEPDSRIGLQLDATFNPMFSATVQLLSKYNGDGNQHPQIEWAFAKANLGQGFSARVGRIGAPFFLVSDFREVGYANVYLRPPTDVYNQVPLRTFDGADLLYAGKLGSVPVTAQAFYGNTTNSVSGTDVRFDRQFGLNLTAEVIDGLTLRAGHIQGDLTVESQDMLGLVGVLATTPWSSVGEQLNCTDRKASFTGLGASLEKGNWVAAAEYTMRRTDCYVSDTTGWYAMVGYRFGNFTPYAIVSGVATDDSNVVNTIPTGIAPPITGLSMAVQGLINSQLIEQRTVALGLRWDAWRNVAVKAQYERSDTRGTDGFFIVNGASPTSPVNVLSLAVDFLF